MRLVRASLLLGCHAGLLFACDGELPLFERAPLGAGTSSAAGGASNLGGSNQGAAAPSGGPSSSGGSESAAGAGPTVSLLIDDMEDGDSRAEGFGWWYSVNDGTSSQGQGWGFEPVNDRENSRLAVRTHGSGFTSWGAILGVTLRESGSLDASQHAALRFWARAQPGSVREMSAQIAAVEGGPFSTPVMLSEVWTEYHLPFSTFRSQSGSELDPTQLLAVQFLFAPHQQFDVWLDDLAFEP